MSKAKLKVVSKNTTFADIEATLKRQAKYTKDDIKMNNAVESWVKSRVEIFHLLQEMRNKGYELKNFSNADYIVREAENTAKILRELIEVES